MTAPRTVTVPLELDEVTATAAVDALRAGAEARRRAAGAASREIIDDAGGNPAARLVGSGQVVRMLDAADRLDAAADHLTGGITAALAAAAADQVDAAAADTENPTGTEATAPPPPKPRRRRRTAPAGDREAAAIAELDTETLAELVAADAPLGVVDGRAEALEALEARLAARADTAAAVNAAVEADR